MGKIGRKVIATADGKEVEASIFIPSDIYKSEHYSNEDMQVLADGLALMASLFLKVMTSNKPQREAKKILKRLSK